MHFAHRSTIIKVFFLKRGFFLVFSGFKDQLDQKDLQLASLEERVSHEASSLSTMQSKIESLETAAQLQVNHLNSVTQHESALQQDLAKSNDEKKDKEKKIEFCTGQLALAQQEASAKESVLHHLSLKLEELEEENKVLKEKTRKSQDLELESIAHIQRTLGSENETLKGKNAELARTLEISNKDLGDLKIRFETKECKYRSQRDLLARQSEVLRSMQERCAHAEDDCRHAKAEHATTHDEVTLLRHNTRQNHDEMRELKMQVSTWKLKSAKGSELNSKLLGLLMSQVVVADNDTPTESSLLQQMHGLSISRPAAGS